VVGCAIARELTRYKHSVLLIEKEHDVALHASSRNDGMVHPGIDLRRGSEKYLYNLRGNELYKTVCTELGVRFRRGGQTLCFPKWFPVALLRLITLYWKHWMGIPVRVLTRGKLFAREPHLHPDLGGALFFPTAGSVCPYNLTIAYAENAIENGAQVSLQTAVLGMEVRDGQIVSVQTNRGVLRPKIVINAAGAFAEDVAALAQDRFFSIHPRRGTNAICDKKTSNRVARQHASTLFTGSSKGAHTKGGGIIRTVHNNLLIGPDAAETPLKEDFSTQRGSIEATFRKQAATSGNLSQGQIITYFTGVRAATFEEDFVVRRGLYTKNILHAAGIQSPGLTAAPALAETIALWAAEDLGDAALRENFNPVRKPIPCTARADEKTRRALIRQNPDFGVVLCRCEQVTRGEIVAALHRPLPCTSVDGVKRRVRPGMGRCQGGFCGPLVAQIISKELDIPLEQVCKGGPGSEVLLGSTKELLLKGGDPA
jgi:glycerol-3-phosphate dehydrogenase